MAEGRQRQGKKQSCGTPGQRTSHSVSSPIRHGCMLATPRLGPSGDLLSSRRRPPADSGLNQQTSSHPPATHAPNGTSTDGRRAPLTNSGHRRRRSNEIRTDKPTATPSAAAEPPAEPTRPDGRPKASTGQTGVDLPPWCRLVCVSSCLVRSVSVSSLAVRSRFVVTSVRLLLLLLSCAGAAPHASGVCERPTTRMTPDAHRS